MLRIQVRVTPGSRREALEWDGSSLRAWVRAPAREGEANAALIALVARYLGIRRYQVSIVHGAAAREKVLALEGLTLEEVQRRLGHTP
ncbi:MAG: DUF167 domain-containing protein [Thermogemmatispora sp.]|jgi:uncharacterized protein YggU (UPF0235/DUF167 family)|uniref:DUF167 domain-containing protein n=1 Tax=Thermogemmatispora sp. TaxID=1968838 RepID=UPI001A0327CA|nr:DUF167 domain-containing protein [Thermogemmatispora sp.]MBE3565749.1 DUF167 domain-containing protein [Thermogemmatispora sp.]